MLTSKSTEFSLVKRKKTIEKKGEKANHYQELNRRHKYRFSRKFAKKKNKIPKKITFRLPKSLFNQEKKIENICL